MNRRRQSPRNPLQQWRRLSVRLLRGLRIVPLVFCLVPILVPQNASGQEDSVDEYKLKAALLYHLTRFVEWPESAYLDRHSPILLCILGEDSFANSLTSAIANKTDNGRIVLIRHLQSDAGIPGCHILYVASSERKIAPHILTTLNRSCILTVGEMAQFAAHGGIIQFSLEDQHVRFEINLDAATRSGLKISSKLLALARIVRN